MSSTPNKQAPGGKPPAERKPPKPIFTPLNVGIVFAIIILASIGVFWKSVYIAKTAEIDSLNARIQQQKRTNEVAKKKAAMLPTAEQLNAVMDGKLADEQHFFLKGQDDIVSFFEEWFLDMLWSSDIYAATFDIEPDIEFKVTYEMDPIETLPPVADAVDLFSWEYVGEGTGTGEVATRMANFLEPMHIKLSEFMMTYERLLDFVERLQTDATYFVTVHGFKNSGGDDNVYSYRTISKWELYMTVYFMNPEGLVSGEVPPGMPGDKKL
jgi:hypothetical protein